MNDIYCPKCEKQYKSIMKNMKVSKVKTFRLIISEKNYHGCGVDIADCPVCEREFQISYKVDKISEIDWSK